MTAATTEALRRRMKSAGFTEDEDEPYKGEIEEARKKGREPRRHQMWRKRNEVRRP